MQRQLDPEDISAIAVNEILDCPHMHRNQRLDNGQPDAASAFELILPAPEKRFEYIRPVFFRNRFAVIDELNGKISVMLRPDIDCYIMFRILYGIAHQIEYYLSEVFRTHISRQRFLRGIESEMQSVLFYKRLIILEDISYEKTYVGRAEIQSEILILYSLEIQHLVAQHQKPVRITFNYRQILVQLLRQILGPEDLVKRSLDQCQRRTDLVHNEGKEFQFLIIKRSFLLCLVHHMLQFKIFLLLLLLIEEKCPACDREQQEICRICELCKQNWRSYDEFKLLLIVMDTATFSRTYTERITAWRKIGESYIPALLYRNPVTVRGQELVFIFKAIRRRIIQSHIENSQCTSIGEHGS